MTIQDIIDRVDSMKRNEIDSSTKMRWINDIEFRVYDDIIAYTNAGLGEMFSGTNDYNYELALDSRWSDVYVYYVLSKIDLARNEEDKAGTNLDIGNDAFNRCAGWYRRNFKPLKESEFTNYNKFVEVAK